MQVHAVVGIQAEYELRFRALALGVQDYSFPCDPHGHVDLDTLSERARNAYFFARVVVGHELAAPQVLRVNEPTTA